MQSVAQSWLVYRLTGSAALLGLVNFANLIPVFLLSPLGGAAADRSSRHRILLITQIVAMLLAFVPCWPPQKNEFIEFAPAPSGSRR